jgi:hypothetical protein
LADPSLFQVYLRLGKLGKENLGRALKPNGCRPYPAKRGERNGNRNFPVR